MGDIDKYSTMVFLEKKKKDCNIPTTGVADLAYHRKLCELVTSLCKWYEY